MAKIENSKPKSSSGGYERLFNDKNMAELFVKAQSTVISNGAELERLISAQAEVVEDLDVFVDDVKDGKVKEGAYLCDKKTVKNSKFRMDKHEPDFLVFVVQRDMVCKVIELKDGDDFDTKKSASEFVMLKDFTAFIAPRIPFAVDFFICCFNQEDKNKIVAGFKNKFPVDNVMTGKEFCELLGISYARIVDMRMQDALDNFRYVVCKMRNIVRVDNRKHIDEADFYED